MKKITLLLVTVFTFGIVNAQDKEDMSFGVKAGLNISSITNADQDGMNSKSLVGFHVGFFGEFMISNEFSIQPELLYSTQGVKLEVDGDKGDLKLDYINVPVMAKYYIADAFSLELGPQIGFLVSSKAKSGGESIDVKDDTKSIDVSLGFGANYNFAEKFMLGARYNLGLTRVQKDLFPGESESKNSVFQISLGYKF
ncbi:porin family protein [Flavobacterium sp. LT1R49]|uniref:porin family protein n=1 Tax=Flavobacterium arabinosi TaxID=3398737 RepID=UPI003A84B42F